jgi:hypothetical protein
MKHFYSVVFFSLFLFTTSAQEKTFNSPAGSKINLFVRNVCSDLTQAIVCDGDSTNNIHPTFGTLDCSVYLYEFHDSLLAFKSVKFFDFDQEGASQWTSKLLSLGNDSLILNYHLSYPSGNCINVNLSPVDTILTDSIADLNVMQDRLIYIRKTNIGNNFHCVFITPFNLHLDFTPIAVSTKIFSDKSAVVGVNQSNEIELAIIDLNMGSILKDTILSSQMKNVNSIKFDNDIYIASSPGDTLSNLLTYDISQNTYTIQNIYSGSGIKVFCWGDQGFYFQPISDTGINHLETHIFFYDFFNHSVTHNDVNKRLKYMQSNSWSYITGTEDIPVTDKIYFYTSGTLQLFDSTITDLNPKFYRGDLRCFVKVDEYDDSKVEWQAYPSPTQSNINLIASGLICGRDYKVDIIDLTGKIKYENTIHSKMVVELPTENYPAGIYFIRIHSLKGLIVQKVVKY